MDLSLKGKNALVSGSTQGIGKATAIELAKLGASVTLLARNETKLKETLKELPVQDGQNHAYYVGDFSIPGEIISIGEKIKSNKIPFHILVNNTGGPAPGPVHLAEIEQFRIAFNQHLICNHILMQAVLEGMQSEKYGRIINVISTSVKQPLPNLGVSNTIRAAVANWAKTLATELASFGITVNNVLPGATATERLTGIIENKAEKTGKDKGTISQEMQNEIPVKRFGEVHEIASAIAFLASPAAAYINGINLPVDGGRTGSL